jgi:hypothetical protein
MTTDTKYTDDRLAHTRPGWNIDHVDFAVVVKKRSSPPKPWGWEIYRAGRKSPIESSPVLFETMTEANRAGKIALTLLLTEFPA